MNYDEARAEYTRLLPTLRDFRAQLVTEISRLLSDRDVEVRSRIKSWDSVQEKLTRKLGGFSLNDMTDLVGIRVVVSNTEDIFDIEDFLAGRLFISSRSTLHLAGLSTATVLVRSVPSFSDGVTAEIQILTAADEGLRAIEHERGYKFQRRDEAFSDSAQVVAPLDEAIATFTSLIERSDVDEKRDIHPFLERWSFLLYPNPDAVVSERPIGLGTQHRMDFVIQKADGSYILVELENSRHPIVNRNGDFSAAVNHALCQVEDWQEWIEQNLPMVQREYPEMAAPEAWVIIGRKPRSEIGRRRLRRRNTNMRGRILIRTYDELIDDAKAYVQSLRAMLSMQ